jgi:hypothetical protein
VTGGLLEEVQRHFEGLDADYAALRERAEGSVSEWRWAVLGDWREMPVPYWVELFYGEPQRKARLTVEPPPFPSAATRYGLDGEGRVHIAEEISRRDETSFDVARERLLRYEDGAIRVDSYQRPHPDVPRVAEHAAAARLENGVVVEWALSGGAQHFERLALEYDGARPARGTLRQLHPDVGVDWTEALEYEYADDGALRAIRTDSGAHFRFYDAADGRAAVKQAAALLRDIVPSSVGAAAEGEVLAVIVAYDPEVLWPPPVGIVLTDAATTLVEAGTSLEDFWDARMHHVTIPPLPDATGAQEAFAGANQCFVDIEDELRKATVKLAKDLNAATWPVRRHADFVVVAASADGTNRAKDLRATAPKGHGAWLRERGLL